MRMLAPIRPHSILRSLTNPTNRSLRFAALIAIVAISGTVLATSNSSASSLSRLLYARASKLVATGAEAKSAHNDHTFAAAESSSSTMATERRAHTATRLADGRVLIAGGENSDGSLNQTEIYDPTTASFSTSGNMSEARADHSATRLADGRVLISGGRNSAGSLASTEIFDPATGSFASGPSMNAARAGHSATLLGDGRVLVAGGDASGTAELLDAAVSAFTSAGALNTARSLHSAALMQDGRVVIVGGKNGGVELSSGEIFDTPAGTFSTINSTLKVARVRPHLRVLFDGKVQIIGGSNDGSMEIYDPLYEGIGAYAHVLPENDPCTGLAGHVLGSQTRAALFHNGQTDPLYDRSGHTITELGGQALVLGGANSNGVALGSSSVVASSSAAISTDKMDYTPGEIAHISGSGFQPGETVRLKIHEDPHTPQERGFDVVADGQGSFSGDYLVTEYDLDMKFLVGARGLASGFTAQTSMTDSNPQAINVAAPISVTVTQGSTAVYGNLTVTKGGNDNLCNINLSAIAGGGTGLPAGATAVFGTNPLAMTTASVSTSLSVTTTGATAPGTYTFRILGTNSGVGCQGPGPGSSVQLLTLVVNSSAVDTTTAVTNATATYGDASVELNATVTPESGPAVTTGSVTFTVKQGPTTIGASVTDTTIIAGAASVTYLLPAGTAAGAYTIEAAYSGASGFNPSSGSGSLAINQKGLTITAGNKTKTYGDTVTFDETTPSTDFSVNGLVNSDTVDSISLASTGAAATATVADSPYAIIPSDAVGTGLGNYNISYVNGSLTVDPRALTITASDKSKTYGDAVVFDETTPSTDFSVNGLVNSDTVDSISLSSTGAAATATVAGSPYAIVPSAAVGTGLANYSISYVNGSLNVDQRPLTITASNRTKTYGDTVTFDETTPSTDFTVGALVNSDTLDSVTLTSAGAAAGAPVLGSPHSIVPSAATGTGVANYNITYVNGTLTVNKASLTITASSHTVTFGDAVPTITPSYTGFVAGDDATDLTTQPTCSTTYTVGSLVGTYPSKCENAASSNYNITYVNGTVTVLTACSVFNGFLAPIGGAVEKLNGGSFSDPLRAFKLNSTIPVKFSAICFGAPLTTGIHTLQAIKYSNATTSDSPIDATPTDSATTGNQFRLTDGQWHYNLSTKGLGSSGQGIWLLKATLFDGSTYTVWVEVKK